MTDKKNAVKLPETLRERRVIYIQFTNPTAYPPLENSASIFSRDGWRVAFLGIRWPGSGNFSFGPQLKANLCLMSAPATGWRQKLFYVKFMGAAVAMVLRDRPDWVYVSDPMTAPVGWLIKIIGFRVIYHEHDIPSGHDISAFMRAILRFRHLLARIADLIVLPQKERSRLFIEWTATKRPVYCVWNCPSLSGPVAALPRVRSPGDPLRVYFHGSINLDRVPLTLIEGAKRSGVPVLLRVVGYETSGSLGTKDQLRVAAENASPMVRLELPGTFSHHELADQMEGMHVGWMAYRCESQDVNLVHLAGASNKAFDYMASGLALLIRNTPAWRELYLIPGFARDCDPEDPDSIAASLRWFYEHPVDTAAMGRSGQKKIQDEWNYECQFAPVLDHIRDSIE